MKRTRDLQGQNASSAADLERAEATERGTRAQVDLLKIRLDRTTVRAPFSGVVGQRFVSLGDYVTTSSRLAALQTVNPQRAVFQVPERYAERLKLGQRVQFRVAALGNEEFTGVVDFVDPIVQLPARTILVKAMVPNGRRQLAAGMFIEARLATATRPLAVLVPEEAILPVQGANFLFVVTDGKAARRAGGARRPDPRVCRDPKRGGQGRPGSGGRPRDAAGRDAGHPNRGRARRGPAHSARGAKLRLGRPDATPLSRQIMTPDPASCRPEETAMEVAQLMRARNVGSVPVVENRETMALVGIITDRDLTIKVIAGRRNPETTSVREVMSPNPITCGPEDDIQTGVGNHGPLPGAPASRGGGKAPDRHHRPG